MSVNKEIEKKYNYDDNSIDSLEGEIRIRTRPASMLGSSGISGARHGLTEIIGNAVDEHNSGFGDLIDITYTKDTSIRVRDYGRGVPLGWNSNKEQWNWFLIYCELYAGGKYDDYQAELKHIYDNNLWDEFSPYDYNYFFAIGLNGLGAASTQYTSSFFNVESYRHGKCTRMEFEKGRPILEQTIITDTDEPDGTMVEWRPDDEVFTATVMGSDFIYDTAKTVAYISQMDVHLIDEIKGIDTVLKAGTLETMFEKTFNADADDCFRAFNRHYGKTVVNTNRDFIYVFDSEVIFKPVKSGGGMVAFHNAVQMRKNGDSAHFKGAYLALKNFFKTVSRDYGVRIKESDYIDRFAIVANGYSNTASYSNQTKDYVDDLFIVQGITNDMEKAIEEEYDKENEVLMEIIDDIIRDIDLKKKLAEQKEVLKQAEKLQTKQTSKKRRNVKKFLPSKYYLKNKVAGSMLFIVEGDSPLGSAKTARDKLTQSLYPIKGKMINPFKNPIDKVLANEEVKDLIQIVGGGIELPEAGQTFNIDDVKFDEIVIMTDADIDGFQIRNLVMLFFYKFMPGLIDSGRLVVVESPLYQLQYPNEYLYAYSDNEFESLIKTHGSPRKTQRYKGLGTMDGKVLEETTMDFNATKRKNVVPIKFNTKDPLNMAIIDALLGEDQGKNRKNIILSMIGGTARQDLEDKESMYTRMTESELEQIKEEQDFEEMA